MRVDAPEKVQSLFPLIFVFLFLSSMSLPRNLIQTDWFREVATYNPVSYMVEGLRSLLITGWDGEALALGFGCALGILVDRADLRLARPEGEDGPHMRRYLLRRRADSPGACCTAWSRTRCSSCRRC